MAKRVLLATRDLFFRGKLQGVVQSGGGEVVQDGPCDVAVIELGKVNAEAMVRNLVTQGVPVLVFGSHVDANALRAAREWGARAMPNSQIESALRALLQI
jgi:hypothetical protein